VGGGWWDRESSKGEEICRWFVQMTGNGKGNRIDQEGKEGYWHRSGTEEEYVGDITGVSGVRVFG
jgi:hypothetical protein